jgi:uncharacterized repeat protein (TIGR03803 family)
VPREEIEMASFRVALLPIVLVGAAGLMAAPQAGAQPFEILHAFENPPAVPSGALVHGPDGLVYGTTEAGGKYDLGTVFRFEPESGRLTVLHHFAGGDDGMSPWAGLVWGGDAFYGTTSGQSYTQPKPGTVFRITQEGALETLHVFQGPDGRRPRAQLVLVGAYLYGTTESGGTSEKGTVFRVQVGSSAGFESLHSFAGSPSDGYQPVAGLSPATDGRLFGTTCYGGSANRGTIFEIGTSGLTVVHSFALAEGSCPYGEPLIDANGDLVGTAYLGGAASSGTIYRYRQSGVLEVLYDFPTGSSPMGGLVQGPDGLLYGLTYGTWAGAPGTLFRLAAATKTLETLYTFDSSLFRGAVFSSTARRSWARAGWDGHANQGTLFRHDVGGTLTFLHRFGMSGVGWTPLSLAVGDGSTLYGTTRSGGAYGRGTAFELNSTGALAVYAFPRHEAEGAASDTDSRVTPSGETDLLYGVRRSESSAVRGSVFTLRPPHEPAAARVGARTDAHLRTRRRSHATGSCGAPPAAVQASMALCIEWAWTGAALRMHVASTDTTETGLRARCSRRPTASCTGARSMAPPISTVP